MSLVVETGSLATSTANSYVDLDYADTYFEDRYNSTWANASDDDKERALLYAGVYLNSLPWKGYKSKGTQGMMWPRIYLQDEDGYYVDDDIVPTRVKYAQCEAALRELTSGTLQPDLARGGKIKRQKVDVLETEWFDGASSKTEFTVIQELLKGYLRTKGSMLIRRS